MPFIIPISVCFSSLSRVLEIGVALGMAYYITSSISSVHAYKNDRERMFQSIYYAVMYYFMLMFFVVCLTLGATAALFFAFRNKYF